MNTSTTSVGTSFENHVRQFAEGIEYELSRASNPGQAKSGSKNKHEGISGFKHQIDISVEAPNGNLVVIECKRFGKPVRLQDVLVFLGRVLDIEAKRAPRSVTGVIVTTKRFTKHGHSLALHYSIQLLQVAHVPDAIMQVRNSYLGVAVDNMNYQEDDFDAQLT